MSVSLKAVTRGTTLRVAFQRVPTPSITFKSSFTRVPSTTPPKSGGAGRRQMAQQTRALFGGGATKKSVPDSLYDIDATTIDGKPMSLSQLRGKVVLFVNVASACGFTPQYADLNKLYDTYKSKGFEIVAQPCNQFGGQEPGSCEVIKDFASRRGAEFTLLEKADVNGSNETPLYSFLKSKSGGLLGSDVKWNFEKVLVDKAGNVVKRYGSMTNPMSIENDIKALL